MKGREAGHSWPIPMPSASLEGWEECLPKPSSLGWGELVRGPPQRAAPSFGRGWGLPQLFLFPQKNVQGPSPGGAEGGGGWGEGLAVQPQSLASVYPHLPAIPHPEEGSRGQ